MALVTSLEPNSKERSTVHKPTRCLYTIVEGTDGARYLQPDTVGSEERAIPDKVSQSIQFDRQAASQLLQLLQRIFPDLAPGASAEPAKSDAESAKSDDEESEDDGEESEDDGEESEDDGEESEEGRMLLRQHRLRERKKRLVKRKKQSVLTATGRLECEVCSFDFAAIYGPLGDGFAECHHRTPLATLSSATTNRLTDLAVVCANCHRMLHRRPYHTVEQLRDVVRLHGINPVASWVRKPQKRGNCSQAT